MNQQSGKKRWILVLISILLLGQPLVARGITVQVDGRTLPMDVAPVTMQGRTMVPLRSIFEALGAETQWDPDNQSIKASVEDTVVNLHIGSPYSMVNGKFVIVDVPPTIINGRTMVPARYVAESLGAKVDWLPDSQTVAITSKDNIVHLPGGAPSFSIEQPLYSTFDTTDLPFDIPENPYEEVIIHYAEDNYARITLDYPNIDIEGRVPKAYHGKKVMASMAGYFMSKHFPVDSSGHFNGSFSVYEKQDTPEFYIDGKRNPQPTLRESLTGGSEFGIMVRLPHITDPNGRNVNFKVRLSEDEQDLYFDINEKKYKENLRFLSEPTAKDLEVIGKNDPRYSQLVDIVNQVVKPGMSDYEKAYAISVWVADNIYYGLNIQGYQGGTLYDVLERRWGVCSGYDKLTVALLQTAGIPARTNMGHITRRGRTEGHQWTSFYADGRWVLVDTTWMSKNQYFGDVDTYSKGSSMNLEEFDIHIINLSETRG